MLSGLTYCAQLYMNSSFSTSAAGAALGDAAADGEPAAVAAGADALGAVVALPPLGVQAARAALPPMRPIAASALRRPIGRCSIRARSRSRSVTPSSSTGRRAPARSGSGHEDEIRL